MLVYQRVYGFEPVHGMRVFEASPRPFLDIAAQASDLHGRNTGAAEHPLGATWAFCGHLWALWVLEMGYLQMSHVNSDNHPILGCHMVPYFQTTPFFEDFEVPVLACVHFQRVSELISSLMPEYSHLSAFPGRGLRGNAHLQQCRLFA